jgi:branched-chain amino acid transport system permease protein
MPPVEILIEGLTQSCIYMTMAFGLVLVFSILGVLNWTHGQLFMLGAYVTFYTTTAAGIPFPVGILLGGVLVAGLGIVIKKFVIDHIGNELYIGVATLVLIGFLEGAASLMFGVEDRGLAAILPGVLNLGVVAISFQKAAVVVFTLIVMAAMYIVLMRTKVGMAIRALAQQPIAASLYGVSTQRLSLIVMGIGCALAGMAGAVMAPLYPINPFIGGRPMVMGLLAIVIGGVGSLRGAIAGGIILGFLNSIIAYYLSYVSEVILFVLVILILLVRPQGLFGAPAK